MNNKVEQITCIFCDKSFNRLHSKGPVPKYCSAGHRQRAYEKNKKDNILLRAEDVDSIKEIIDEAGSNHLRAARGIVFFLKGGGDRCTESLEEREL